MELKQQDMLSQLIVDGSDESKFCMLLGAGASLSSGIPTAREMVDEWKEDLKFIESRNNEDLQNITIVG